MAEPEGIVEILENDWRALVDEVAPGDDVPSPLALPKSRRRPMTPLALFAMLEEVREEWRGLRESIGAEDAARFVNAAWTLRDLVAHVASWSKEFRHEVETVVTGGSFDYAIPYVMTVMGPNEWNEEQVRARDTQSLEEGFEEIDAETTRLQDLLFEMSEKDLYEPKAFPFAPTGDPGAKWRGPSAFIFAAKCEHDRHHIRQLKERLASWR